MAGRRHVASIEVVFQAYAHYLKGTSRSETECAAELHAWLNDIRRDAFTAGWTAARTEPNIAAASHSPRFPGDGEISVETEIEGGIRYKEDAGDESAIRPTTLAHIEYLHTWADHIFDYFTRRKAGPWTPDHTMGGQ